MPPPATVKISIPNLVETVKAYAKQERTVFTRVAEARAKLAIAENYPQLKSNENFRAL